MASGRVLRHAVVDSPVGVLRLVASGHGIAGIYLENHVHPLAGEVLGACLDSVADDPFIAQCAGELAEYFDGSRRSFDVPCDAQGSDFQKRVWEQLARIPFGESRSYGRLALDLGDEKLSRAVGTANGRNPIAILVPCHRVIGADGSLTGYAGGLDAKEFLLRHEGILPEAEATLF